MRFFCSGSPPHMRGKGRMGVAIGYGCRITPAHAGKSIFSINCFTIFWDHPRTCGEKTYFHLQTHLLLGSPPHMRGKVYSKSVVSTSKRITPAHAGKSMVLQVQIWLVKRITPAHAGKSLQAVRRNREY